MTSDFKDGAGIIPPAELAKVSVIVTAYNREEMTLKTIRILQNCKPAPGEILVHFDHGSGFPLPDDVQVLRSNDHAGPGGARNQLIHEARNEWVASFDDDSYPLESEFFLKVSQAADRHPDAGVLACVIRHPDPVHDAPSGEHEREVASFIGCGCVYRKAAFLQTVGYLPLPVAYGMEEVDVALQMHDKGLPVVEISDLEVFHDTHLSHHQSAQITSGAIMNQALLVWRRYPLLAFPLGVSQWLNKIRDSVARRRFSGVLRGVLGTPLHVWTYRHGRRPVSWTTLKTFRRLSRR